MWDDLKGTIYHSRTVRFLNEEKIIIPLKNLMKSFYTLHNSLHTTFYSVKHTHAVTCMHARPVL